MEERPLNEKESLELISQMIRNTQQRFQKENASPFLAYGYTTVILSVIIWYLIRTTDNYYWNLLWFGIPLLGYFAMKLFFPNRKRIVKTFVDKAVDAVWLVCGISMVLVSFVAFWIRFPILFEIVFLIGIAVTVTGFITKMKLLIVTGALNILSSLLIVFNIIKGIDQILLFGAIFLLFMVVPGHILYYKGKKSHV